MNACFNAGINSTVTMNAARENPTDAWSGWPSLLKISAPEATRPTRVKPERRIEFADGIGGCLLQCQSNIVLM